LASFQRLRLIVQRPPVPFDLGLCLVPTISPNFKKSPLADLGKSYQKVQTEIQTEGVLLNGKTPYF
jgi:hypothetical protein